MISKEDSLGSDVTISWYSTHSLCESNERSYTERATLRSGAERCTVTMSARLSYGMCRVLRRRCEYVSLQLGCPRRYRMVEFYYWREGSGGKSRLECVVLFLPDVWSALPSRVDWTTVTDHYKAACDAALRQIEGAPEEIPEGDAAGGGSDAPDTSAADKSQIVCSQFCLVCFRLRAPPLYPMTTPELLQRKCRCR